MDHREGAFRPILSSFFWPNSRSERCSLPFSDGFSETVWKIVRVTSGPCFIAEARRQNRPVCPSYRLIEVPVWALCGLSKQILRECSMDDLQALTNSTCQVAPSVSRARNRSSGVLGNRGICIFGAPARTQSSAKSSARRKRDEGSSKVARWIEQKTDRQDVSTQRGREYLRKLGNSPQVPQPSLKLRRILKNRRPLKRVSRATERDRKDLPESRC
jgi:hypothetical protein